MYRQKQFKFEGKDLEYNNFMFQSKR
jgi:hypothetical protein